MNRKDVVYPNCLNRGDINRWDLVNWLNKDKLPSTIELEEDCSKDCILIKDLAPDLFEKNGIKIEDLGGVMGVRRDGGNIKRKEEEIGENLESKVKMLNDMLEKAFTIEE